MDTEHVWVRELAERMAAAWMAGDVAAIVDLFAPGGVFVTPGGRAEGHAAIAALAGAFFAGAPRVAISIQRALADGDLGAIEWIWTESDLATGRRRVIEDAIVFERRDGKLVYWREYFDPAQNSEL